LFSNRPKIEPQQTDKTEAVSKPLQLTAASAPEPWVVEVLQGPQTHKLRFESDAKGAKQLTAGTRGALGGRSRLGVNRPAGRVSRLGLSGNPTDRGAAGGSVSSGDLAPDYEEVEEESRDVEESRQE
jgi:hypothetical protein